MASSIKRPKPAKKAVVVVERTDDPGTVLVNGKAVNVMPTRRKRSPQSIEKFAKAGEPYRWKPGTSPNPQGRPKKKSVLISEAVKFRLTQVEPTTGLTYAELIGNAVTEVAADTSNRNIVAAVKEVREMSEGLLPQDLNINAKMAGDAKNILFEKLMGRRGIKPPAQEPPTDGE